MSGGKKEFLGIGLSERKQIGFCLSTNDIVGIADCLADDFFNLVHLVIIRYSVTTSLISQKYTQKTHSGLPLNIIKLQINITLIYIAILLNLLSG